MTKLKLKSATLLILASMMSTAFAAEPTNCDYYAPREIQLENSEKFTSTDRQNVASLFTKVAATCTAKGAKKVAAKYETAASNCLKIKDCKKNYNDFKNDKGGFFGTISTDNWCGYRGTKTKPSDPKIVYGDLVNALNDCNTSPDKSEYHGLLTNAADKLCGVKKDGVNHINTNPPKACTNITDKLYQPKPRWY